MPGIVDHVDRHLALARTCQLGELVGVMRRNLRVEIALDDQHWLPHVCA